MTRGILTEKVLNVITPIIIATRKGFNAIVSELLRNGADPKKLDLIGQSAYEYANAKTLAVLNFETAGDAPENDDEEEEEAKETE
ncbi:hypothetical protein M9Y10_029208 [Tritrichomonas musculus]|uniref:Ankyrin repeat protein n=1 Tax=Tritrichomonas musculus TaxID=1915356 RepID=A0ABR2KLN2_9EUKA